MIYVNKYNIIPEYCGTIIIVYMTFSNIALARNENVRDRDAQLCLMLSDHAMFTLSGICMLRALRAK